MVMSLEKLSKEEICAKLNEVLALSNNPIDFTKLSKDELVRLYEAVENLSVGGSLLGLKILNRPVGELLEMRLKDVLKEIKNGKGILGLGLIDKLFGTSGKKQKKCGC